MSERTPDGTFKAGTSGNPGGRPALSDEEKAAKRAIKELAQEHTGAIFEKVLAIALGETKAKDGIVLKAGMYLLNQAWGSPAAAPPSTPQGVPQTIGFYMMTDEEAAEARRKAAESDGDEDDDA